MLNVNKTFIGFIGLCLVEAPCLDLVIILLAFLLEAFLEVLAIGY